MLIETTKKLQEQIKQKSEWAFSRAEQRIFDVMEPIVTEKKEEAARVEIVLGKVTEKTDKFEEELVEIKKGMGEIEELR